MVNCESEPYVTVIPDPHMAITGFHWDFKCDTVGAGNKIRMTVDLMARKQKLKDQINVKTGVGVRCIPKSFCAASRLCTRTGGQRDIG